jgi:diguanylate cyclase (GGDEF)-like protein
MAVTNPSGEPATSEVSNLTTKVVRRATPLDGRGPSACLVQIYPADKGIGCRHQIEGEPYFIGRDPCCSICLEDDSVSGFHAHLAAKDGKHYLTDHRSATGTFVNDSPAFLRELHDGDRVRVGRYLFRYLAGDDIDTLYQQEMARLAVTDGLTGFANQHHLMEFLERELVRTARYEQKLSLLLLDIDRLKAVNDRLGHLVGDLVLRELARRLRPVVRKQDLLARPGGADFAAVLLECPALAAVDVAQRLRNAVETIPFAHRDEPIQITISVGIATAEKGRPLGAAELIRQADDSLYQAKQEGGNRTG